MSSKQIQIERERLKTLKEDSSVLKRFEERLKAIYINEFEEIFPVILNTEDVEFIDSLLKRIYLVLEDTYTEAFLEIPEFKPISRKLESYLYKSMYIPNYRTLFKAWSEYIFNQNKLKSKQEASYLTNYRTHCWNTSKFALHPCGEKLIEVYDGNNSLSHVICVKCKECYRSSCIKLKCIPCDMEYYTSAIDPNKKDSVYATWETYHCSAIINDIMKCVKCKFPFFIDLDKRLLYCKQCEFQTRPSLIKWICLVCKKEFRSEAKAYNPLEYRGVKYSIKNAILGRVPSKPKAVPCCGYDINSKDVVFFHKRECKGRLFEGVYNGKAIVACEFCRTMNFYDKFIWTCIKCSKRFRQKAENKQEARIEAKPNEPQLKEISKVAMIRNSRNAKNSSSGLDKLEGRYLTENPNTDRPRLSECLGQSRPSVNIQIEEKSIRRTCIDIVSKEVSTGTSVKVKNLIDILEEKKQDKKSRSALNGLLKEDLKDCSLTARSKTGEVVEAQRKSSRKSLQSLSPSNVSDYHSNPVTSRKRSVIEIANVNGSQKEIKSGINANNLIEPPKDNTSEKPKDTSTSPPLTSNIDKNRLKIIKQINPSNERTPKPSPIESTPSMPPQDENPPKQSSHKETQEQNQASAVTSNTSNTQTENPDDLKKDKKRMLREYYRRASAQEGKEASQEEEIPSGRHKQSDPTYNKEEPGQKRNLNLKEYYKKHRGKNSSAEASKQGNLDNETACELTQGSKSSKLENYSTLGQEGKYSVIDGDLNDIASSYTTEDKNTEVPIKKEKQKITVASDALKNFYLSSMEKLNEKRKSESIKKLEKTDAEEKSSSYSTENKEEPENKTEDMGQINIEEQIIMLEKNQQKPRYNIKSEAPKKTLLEELKILQQNEKLSEKDLKPFSIQTQKAQPIPFQSPMNTLADPQSNTPDLSKSPCQDPSQFKQLPLIDTSLFRILGQIGEGTYGKIYSIQDSVSNKFALKKIICDNLRELKLIKSEFELVHMNSHENILTIYGYNEKELDETTFALYIITELAACDWEIEVSNRFPKGRFYREDELVGILKQLSACLGFLQSRKIAHRDIKPQNILVFSNGVYKLGDFGEAKQSTYNRAVNTVRGTELYMSPLLFDKLREDVNDVHHNIYKSDVFSLGYCIIYAGSLTFESIYEIRENYNKESILETVRRYFHDRYSDRFIELVMMMIDFEERDRPDFLQLNRLISEQFP